MIKVPYISYYSFLVGFILYAWWGLPATGVITSTIVNADVTPDQEERIVVIKDKKFGEPEWDDIRMDLWVENSITFELAEQGYDPNIPRYSCTALIEVRFWGADDDPSGPYSSCDLISLEVYLDPDPLVGSVGLARKFYADREAYKMELVIKQVTSTSEVFIPKLTVGGEIRVNRFY